MSPVHVVQDDPDRMATMLAALYSDVSDVLAAQAPGGLIPLAEISVQTMPWHGVHARTSRQDGRTVIIFSLGLVNLLYLMIRALASRAVVAGGQAAPDGDIVGQLAEVLDLACAPIAPLRAGHPAGPEQVKIAELHAEWAEWFLLAHELAHAHRIDERALATMPVLADFAGQEQRRVGLEHAADLFGAWLLRKMADSRVRQYLQHAGAGGPEPPDGAQLMAQNAGIAYAGTELTLHAMNLIEDFDPASRPTMHPTAEDRIRFLRAAMERDDDGALLADAAAWSRLLAANAPQAVALAAVNRDVAARELAAVLDRGERAADPAWLDDPGIGTFLNGSRSGSMGLLIRELTTAPDGAPRRTAALALAERYLPRDEPAYAPFWAAATSGEGGWT